MLGRPLQAEPRGDGMAVAEEEIYLRFELVSKYLAESKFQDTLRELEAWAEPALRQGPAQQPHRRFSAQRLGDDVDLIRPLPGAEAQAQRSYGMPQGAPQATEDLAAGPHVSLIAQ